ARVILAGLAAMAGAAAVVRAGWPPAIGVLAALALAALVLVGERAAAHARIERLVWGTVGGLIGLVAGIAVGVVVRGLVPALGPPALSLGALLGSWLGVAVGIRRGSDQSGLNALLFPRPAPE